MSTYILYTIVAGEMTEFSPPLHFHSIAKAESARQLEERFQRTYLCSQEDWDKLKKYEDERKAKYGN